MELAPLIESFKKLDKIQTKFREISKEIYHSRPLVTYSLNYTIQKPTGKKKDDGTEETEEDIIKSGFLHLDLRDVMLIGPTTQTNTIITGKSGSAKTHLAEIMLAVCYGVNNYGFLPINSSLSEEKLRDFVFSVIKEGKALSDATKETLITSAPGVLMDEINRAPKEILGILQNYLQNGKLVFEGGRQITPGVMLQNGKVYQFKIGTCNEGREYAVFQMGKAYRDRFGFEIPISSFPMTEEDKRQLETKLSTGLEFDLKNCTENNLENLLAIDDAIKQVPIDPFAKEMIKWLSRMSNCVKSVTKNKEDIEMTKELCQGCHAIGQDKMICPEVRAPTERMLINLQHIGKAFAFMRGYKIVKAVSDGLVNTEFMQGYFEKAIKRELAEEFLEYCLSTLSVTTDDIKKAAQFVLLNKIDMTPEWVKKEFQGNQSLAIDFLTGKIEERVKNYYKANSDLLHAYLSSEDADNFFRKRENRERMERHARKDPWCIDLKDLANLEKEDEESKQKEGPRFDLLGKK